MSVLTASVYQWIYNIAEYLWLSLQTIDLWRFNVKVKRLNVLNKIDRIKKKEKMYMCISNLCALVIVKHVCD